MTMELVSPCRLSQEKQYFSDVGFDVIGALT